MAIKVIVVPHDEQQPIREQEIDKSNPNAYRELVGGNLEVVQLYWPSSSMYLNEEGKEQVLPVNKRATALLWIHAPVFHGRDFIVGDAFLVGQPDKHGDDTTVPAELVKLLLHTERYRVEVKTAESEQWSTNQRVFTAWMSAYEYAIRLVERWTALKDVRVVPAN